MSSKIEYLDPVDQRILGFITENLTYQEMADELHRPARSGMFRRVERLVLLGLVTKGKKKSRSRRLTANGQRFLDSILAS